jgi:hypothetical protein
MTTRFVARTIPKVRQKRLCTPSSGYLKVLENKALDTEAHHILKLCVLPLFRVRIRESLSATDLAGHSSPGPFMIVRTVEQVRRAFRIVAGFTLLLAGVVMIVTPGPGWLVIFLGLSLLAAEFIWARRLMERMKREGDRVRDAVWSTSKNPPPPVVSAEQASESNKVE